MTRAGRRCCERYDALMEKIPAYEAAVEALRELERVGRLGFAEAKEHPGLYEALKGASEALRRLQEQTQ